MKKIALCIGNNNYKSNKLLFAENDAISMGEVLNNLGFNTKVCCNLSKSKMIDEINSFFDGVDTADVIVFYYAGHGCELNNENVLVPIEIDFNQSEGGIRQKSYELKELLRHLGHFILAKKIIILDACRTISTGARSFGSNGFSPISSPKNTLIAFSTSPNMVALEDSDTKHGLYTSVLLEKLSIPRIHVESMFKQVRIDVIRKCEAKNPDQDPQISWEHSSLIEDFYFNPASIYQGPEYIRSAYFDQEFKEYASNDTKKIIELFRSHDFNQQNNACALLRSLQFEQLACLNDLFVIGRNITQAANGLPYYSHESSRFICNFLHERIPHDAKKHILNGMAYEVYFDHNNSIRRKLKTDSFSYILNYLESDQFLDCQQFISSKLTKLEDNFFYIPGSKTVILLQISIGLENGNYYLQTVKHNNRLLYDAHFSNAESFWLWGLTMPFIFLRKHIAKSVGAEESSVSLTLCGVNNIIPINEDVFISYPDFFNHYI